MSDTPSAVLRQAAAKVREMAGDSYDARALDRIAASVAAVPSGCLIWQKTRSADGYGRMKYRGVFKFVHRLTYTLTVAPIPDGYQIDHLCRNPPCVNPAHLEPVTAQVNTLRGIGPSAANALKTHCPRGHAYDAGNTYVEKKGARSCKTCRRERNRIFMRGYSARKRARLILEAGDGQPVPDGAS